MLNALTTLSLLLCLGTCVLWVRSHWATDEYRVSKNGWLYVAGNTRDAVSVMVVFPGRTGRGQLGYLRQKPMTMPRGLFHQPPGVDPGEVSERSLPGIYWRISNGGQSSKPQTNTIPTPRGPIKATGRPIYTPRRDILVAHWAVALLFALLPGAMFVRWLFPGRARTGTCAKCSYDLTGNVSGVCPECGRKIAES
jgi:hypothetical protein